MFTDVESSTDLTTRLGDGAAAPRFAAHDRIVREQVAAHGGHAVRSTGDGFLLRFDSARSAVECALAIQRELASLRNGLQVRIGLHAGEVTEGDGELFGGAVNLAARVMGRAVGGEILVTDTVRQLAGTMPEVRFRDRGRAALKGIPDRRRLYEVQPGDGRIRRRRSRRPLLAAATLAAVAVALAVALTGSGGLDPVTVKANSVAILDPDDGRIVGQISVGVRPTTVAAGAGSLWVANDADNNVTEIGARSREVTGTLSAGIDVDGLAAGPDAVWVADNERAIARVIDPGFPTAVARSVRIGDPSKVFDEVSRPMAVTADAVWITYGIAEIARLDPDTSRVVETIPVGNSPSGLAVGAGAVWVADDVDGTVTRIDRRTNDVVESIPVGQSVSAVAVGAGGVWVTVPREDRVKRIDPATNAIADTVRVGGGPAALAVDVATNKVWVTSRRGGTVTSIDAAAARISRTIPIGNSPQGIAVTDGAIWVAVQAAPAPSAPAVGRSADTLAVLYPQRLEGGTDPTRAFPTAALYATCGLLVSYPDAAVPATAQVQPEIARALPTVSPDGRTYRFRVRPGFRFSPPSNAPVTAHAFRRALERALHPTTQSFAQVLMTDIVGFDAYWARRAKRLAGVRVRGDTLEIRLKAPSPTLPARLAMSFFCAVPPTTPISAAGIEQIPMAGPYYIASYVPKRRLVLRRNPNYGGRRPARIREIDLDLDVDGARAAATVEAGRADYATAVPLDRVAALERRYGRNSPAARAGRQRYFSGEAPIVHFFALNAQRPLFAGRRMRQAASASLDRAALARSVGWFGVSTPGRATDQFIPPGQPGFRDVAVHPLGGPDLARARDLADGRRHRAVLYTCTASPCLEQSRVLRRNLAAIGIDVEVKSFPVEEMFKRLARPDEPWDLAMNGYYADYADPSQFVVLFETTGNNFNVGRFRDPMILRRMRAAARLTGAPRTAAFAQLDADLARAGAAAPFATSTTTDFFSDRIGCQVHQPMYGISLGALCVRR